MVTLLAQRGVRGENPENTMPAFQAASDQGYGYIGLTARVTKDGRCVVLHDKTVNRTARYPDGSPIQAALPVAERSFAQLRELDFGIGYHIKFRGTRIPALEDVLELCRSTGLRAKLDASWYQLRDAHKEILLTLLNAYRDVAELSADTPEGLEAALGRFPGSRVHYEGLVTETVLTLAEQGNVFFWARKQNRESIPAGKPWGILDAGTLEEAEALGAEMAATDGRLKPVQNQGLISDMHVHTDHSHDAHYPMEDMARAGMERGVRVIAMADHCDVTRCENNPDWDIYTHIRESCAEVDALNEKLAGQCLLLRSVELGDGIWYPEQSGAVATQLPYDVIVGATHAVRCQAAEAIPLKEKWFSQIKFQNVPEEQYLELMDNYFADMLAMVEHQNIDIMAHLLCVVCYYWYRHGICKDVRPWEEPITRILEAVIRKGIAMEMNEQFFLSVDGQLPYYWIVEKYRSLGGYLITLSTDAHAPNEVGAGYEIRLRMLKETGFTHTFYYKDRKAVPCSL